jgi:hypothetical protein
MNLASNSGLAVNNYTADCDEVALLAYRSFFAGIPIL